MDAAHEGLQNVQDLALGLLWHNHWHQRLETGYSGGKTYIRSEIHQEHLIMASCVDSKNKVLKNDEYR